MGFHILEVIDDMLMMRYTVYYMRATKAIESITRKLPTFEAPRYRVLPGTLPKPGHTGPAWFCHKLRHTTVTRDFLHRKTPVNGALT